MVPHLRYYYFLSLLSLQILFVGCGIDYSLPGDAAQQSQISQCESSQVCQDLKAKTFAIFGFEGDNEAKIYLDFLTSALDSQLSSSDIITSGGFRGDTLSISGNGSDKLIVKDTAVLRLNLFSISFWFKTPPSYQTGFVPLITKHAASGSKSGWHIGFTYKYNSSMSFYPWFFAKNAAGTEVCKTSTNNPLNKDKAFNDDQWHHVVVNINLNPGQDTEIYVDGAFFESCTTSASVDSTGNDMIFGDAADWFWKNFQGEIDEAYFFSDSLNAEEIDYLSQYSFQD